MNVSMKITGIVQAIKAIDVVRAGAQAVSGPIATFGSSVPYAMPVEKVWRRGSGGAKMFERGVAKAAELARKILPAAIIKGPASVGQAKRQIRDYGKTEIQAGTPVRTGKLRASVSELNRPGIGGQ